MQFVRQAMRRTFCKEGKIEEEEKLLMAAGDLLRIRFGRLGVDLGSI